MASITVNGLPVLECRLTADEGDAWVFRCTAHADEKLAGAVAISDGEHTWNGTVVASDVIAQECEALIVGGRGKLGSVPGAKHYVGTPASVVAAAIVADVGEQLAQASLSAAGLRKVPTYWTRADDTAGAELSRLVEDVGETWRVLPSGQVWIGTPAWRPTAAQTTELDRHGGRRARTLAIDGLGLEPGSTVRGERVKRVEYRSYRGQLRATIWVP